METSHSSQSTAHIVLHKSLPVNSKEATFEVAIFIQGLL
jgi:hypothetical protein